MADTENEAAGRPPVTDSSTSEIQLPSSDTHDLVYCCRKCRRPLFTPEQLTDHDTGKHAFAYRRQAKEKSRAVSTDGVGDAVVSSSSCSSFFLQDALQWMEVGGGSKYWRWSSRERERIGDGRRVHPSCAVASPRTIVQDASSDVEGKLNCQKCAVRVGTLKWVGSQCSCESTGESQPRPMARLNADIFFIVDAVAIRCARFNRSHPSSWPRCCRRDVGVAGAADLQEGCRRAVFPKGRCQSKHRQGKGF